MRSEHPHQSTAPMFRGVSHLALVVVAWFAGYVLVSDSAPGAMRSAVVIYSVAVVFLFSASGMYQRLRISPTFANPLRRIDQATIYMFAGASYVPFMIYSFTGNMRAFFVIAITVATVCGMTARFLLRSVPRYFTFGTFAVFAVITLAMAPRMLTHAPLIVHLLIYAGGISYAIGAAIYVKKIPVLSPRFFGHHELFHVFVNLGVMSQFVAIYLIAT